LMIFGQNFIISVQRSCVDDMVKVNPLRGIYRGRM
jgi:hypothetical protein